MTRHHDPEPDALSPAHVQLLDAYRHAHAMPSEARVRVRRRLAARRTAAAVPDRRAVWIAGAFAVAAALLLAVWGVWRGRDDVRTGSADAARDHAAFDHDPAPPAGETRTRAAATGTPRASTRVPAVEHTSEASAPAVDSARTEPSPAETDVAAPSPRRTPPRAADPQPSPAPGPSALDQEREVMARAWRALARDDYDGALEVTREHAERFAGAILEIERRAVERIVACERGREGAAAAAATFLEHHGRTPVARQVREACGLDVEKKSTAG